MSLVRYSRRFLWQMRERWARGEAWYEEVWIPTLCAALQEGVATVVGVAGGETSRYARLDDSARPAADGVAFAGGGEGGGEQDEDGCVLATLKKLRGALRGGTTPCSVGAGAGAGGGSSSGGRCAWASPQADRFRFRPSWPCEDFVAAVAAEDAGFWHPVKERGCWRDYLDACNASGCAHPRSSPSSTRRLV